MMGVLKRRRWTFLEALMREDFDGNAGLIEADA
jgi:hypothetical protein